MDINESTVKEAVPSLIDLGDVVHFTSMEDSFLADLELFGDLAYGIVFTLFLFLLSMSLIGGRIVKQLVDVLTPYYSFSS